MVLLEINIEAYPEPSFIWKQLMSDVEYPFAKTEKVSENNFISTLELILDQSSFGYYIITVQNIINGEINAKTWGIKIIELDPGTNTISCEQSVYQEGLGAGIGIGIGISAVIVILVILTIFIYRKYHPANKKLPEESYATFSNINPEVIMHAFLLTERTYEDLNTRPEVNDNNQHNSGDVKEYENMRRN
ncbi:hypothetical protein LOTGIDRAFT_174569 [Lottia gigantea]|uniref:Immunoglobulin I-set domain-containing protein n=1 Tax=Lottia gigantea TaxID=225164 RepID=V4C6A7_LOTGI|nr:hypothetical protein LOTGIDRAFT_174569 [Lottia gigantea]ESO97184.1 hypothetical protein LOTGIDRAFT_174569 [Lottia gigantea]